MESPQENPHFLPNPPFTIKELRDCIPPHCFERNLFKSLFYLTRDLFFILILYFLSSFIDFVPFWFQCILWPCFWFAQGSVMTGVWIIAHECGHQAFSNYKIINDCIGFVLHSFLLIPYHSWRITHSQHHKSNSHFERDTAFVPPTKEIANKFFQETPVLNLIPLIILLFIGWPIYLIFNVGSQRYNKRANHFDPSSPYFKEKDRHLIIWSDIGLLAVLSLFAWLIQIYGVIFWVKYYFVPYTFVNFWLVTITYLHHTDMRVPKYRGQEWNFVRGALSTVDRDYGVFNYIHHHIGDSHIVHHLFSTIPHYHAIEATPYLKKFLGKYYIEEKENVFVSLWKNWNSCHWVESAGEILFFKNNKMIKAKEEFNIKNK